MIAVEMVRELELLALWRAYYGHSDWIEIDRVRLKLALTLDFVDSDGPGLHRMWRYYFANEQPDLTAACQKGADTLEQYAGFIQNVRNGSLKRNPSDGEWA